MIYQIWRVRSLESGWLLPAVYADEEQAMQDCAGMNNAVGGPRYVVEESTLDDGLPVCVGEH